MKRFLKCILVVLLVVSLLAPSVVSAASTGTKEIELSRFQVLKGVLYLDMKGVPENGTYRTIIVKDDKGGLSISTPYTTGITTDGLVGKKITVTIKEGNTVLGEYVWLLHNHYCPNVITPATCQKTGLQVFKCSQGCDGIRIHILPKKDHSYKAIKKVDSTCIKKGYVTYKCVNGCNKTVTKALAVKPHTKSKYINSGKATCKNKAYKRYYCSVCKKNFNVYYGNYAKHTYKCIKTVKAVDGKDGYKKYKCTVCGKQYTKKLSTGYVGTVNCSAIGVKVKVYDSSKTSPKVDGQVLCDRKNSATGFKYGGQYAIADHNYQGFSKINNAVVNKTTLTYKGKTYKCYKKFKGHNKNGRLTTWEGADIISMNKGGLVLYTCRDNWKNITVTFWKKI